MHIKTPFGLREKQAKAIHPKKKKASKSEVHKTSNLSLALLLLSKT
jgi:hypothetical protein